MVHRSKPKPNHIFAARTWKTFTRQKLSVALHRAVATELVQALGLSHVADTRD